MSFAILSFLFVACWGNQMELKSIDGHTLVSTLVGTGLQSSADGIGVFAGLDTPYAIALDHMETVAYATDLSGQGLISKIVLATAYKTTIGSGIYFSIEISPI